MIAMFKAIVTDIELPPRGPLRMTIEVFTPYTQEDVAVAYEAFKQPVSRPVDVTLCVKGDE